MRDNDGGRFEFVLRGIVCVWTGRASMFTSERIRVYRVHVSAFASYIVRAPLDHFASTLFAFVSRLPRAITQPHNYENTLHAPGLVWL